MASNTLDADGDYHGPWRTPMLDVIACPRCRGSLTVSDADQRLSCDDCGRTFPSVDSIPLLFDDPRSWIDRWEGQIADFVRDNADVRAKILAQMTAEPALPRTRARLERLHAGLEEHAERLLGLLGEAGLRPGQPRDPRQPLPDQGLGEGTITAYYHQMHRDWGWDDTENDEAAEMASAVAEILGDVPLGKTLVLGAGGCRLPHDLHRNHGGTVTVAVDVNPLPFFVARRVIAGQEVRLFELPLRPRTTERACVDRVLKRHGPATEGLHLVFADGLDPPVRSGAFDTVFTPWFIDQIPRDIASILPVLREVLAPGGRWLNFGPLIYQPSHTHLVHRYCVDEVLELAEACGFEVERHRYGRMRYMESPACTQGRTEHVLVSLARKTDAAPPGLGLAEPTEAWLSNPDLPVPLLSGLDTYRAPHPMFEAVARLIDGRRTTAEIAALLVERHGLPPDAATVGVQACLREIARALTR